VYPVRPESAEGTSQNRYRLLPVTVPPELDELLPLPEEDELPPLEEDDPLVPPPEPPLDEDEDELLELDDPPELLEEELGLPPLLPPPHAAILIANKITDNTLFIMLALFCVW
jgi:hypothetical protein